MTKFQAGETVTGPDGRRSSPAARDDGPTAAPVATISEIIRQAYWAELCRQEFNRRWQEDNGRP